MVKIRGALKFDLLRFYVSRLQKQSDDFKSVHHFKFHFGRFEFEYQVEKREENKDKIEVIMINKNKACMREYFGILDAFSIELNPCVGSNVYQFDLAI